MPIKKKENREIEILENLLIVELAKAGVPQLEIQKIMSIDVNRIGRIAKYFKKSFNK